MYMYMYINLYVLLTAITNNHSKRIVARNIISIRCITKCVP